MQPYPKPFSLEKMETVKSLTEKYKGHPYMAKKVDHYLKNLPAFFDSIERAWEERLAKKVRVAEDISCHANAFFEAHNLYYMPHNNTFLCYANNTMKPVSEEDVRHMIFKFIHNNMPVFPFKFKLRRYIMRQIRTTSIWSAEPTQLTKDAITNALYPSFFETPVLAEYFLTAVGDLLRGRRDLLYFLHTNYRDMIGRMDDELSAVGRSVSERFKFKYYDHDFELCRVIPGEMSVLNKLRLNGYDLAIVASTMSKAHSSADAFLVKCGDEALLQRVMKLKLHTKDDIIVRFFAEFTIPDGRTHMKTMYFLWKTYLHRYSLPAVISKSGLKEWAVANGLYDKENDCFSVTPRDSSTNINLATFWSEHVKFRRGESYDLVELTALYNNWCDPTLECSVDECRSWLSNSFPEDVSGNEVRNYVCDLWDKSVDIDYVLEISDPEMTAEELYQSYKVREFPMTANEMYFKKYITDKKM